MIRCGWNLLTDADELIQPRLDQLTGPLSLWLEVGLPPHVPLLDHHDLDNYLRPLVTRLGRRHTFVSVWGTKQSADTSHLRATDATSLQRPAPESCLRVRTTASSESAGFKHQIHDQLADALPLANGPVALQLAFVVGPRRNWLNLWPTIDALDRILGLSPPIRSWHPGDGRIVQLGLHCRVDPAIGHDVVVEIDAQTTNGRQP